MSDQYLGNSLLKRSDVQHNFTKEEIRKENIALIKSISDDLSPRIVHCSKEADVSREAAAMINAAIKEETSVITDKRGGVMRMKIRIVMSLHSSRSMAQQIWERLRIWTHGMMSTAIFKILRML